MKHADLLIVVFMVLLLIAVLAINAARSQAEVEAVTAPTSDQWRVALDGGMAVRVAEWTDPTTGQRYLVFTRAAPVSLFVVPALPQNLTVE